MKKVINKKILSLGLVGLMTFTQAGVANTLSDVAQDTAITAQVKSKYLADPLLKTFDISVTTDHHVVNLSGMVDTNVQYDRAIELASNLDNVKDVEAKNLKVKDSQSLSSDIYITAKVKAILIKDNFMKEGSSTLDVHVETKDNIVYLTGTVLGKNEQERIEKIVKSIEGVKSVKSDLHIQS